MDARKKRNLTAYMTETKNYLRDYLCAGKPKRKSVQPSAEEGKKLIGTKPNRKYAEWSKFIETCKNAQAILEALGNLPEHLRPSTPARWLKVAHNTAEDQLAFYNGLPEHLRPQERITWNELRHDCVEKTLELLNAIPKHLHPKNRIEWHQLKRRKAEDTIAFFEALPKHLRPRHPIGWVKLRLSTVADTIKFYENLPENLRPQEYPHWLEIKHSAVKDSITFLKWLVNEKLYYEEKVGWSELRWGSTFEQALELFKALPKELRPAAAPSWADLSKVVTSVSEAQIFLSALPENLRPTNIGPFSKHRHDGYFEDLQNDMGNLEHDDPRWSPGHENSISVLAPRFFSYYRFPEKDFETWLSLTQLDSNKLLRTYMKRNNFRVLNLLTPKDLDDAGLAAYFRNTLFPEGRWIGGDLGRAIGYLRDMEEQTAASESLMQLLEAARLEAETARLEAEAARRAARQEAEAARQEAEASRRAAEVARRAAEAARLFEKRFPQLENQTIHVPKTKSHYENAFEALQARYPNRIQLNATTFKGICMSLVNLTPEERQDALSQFKFFKKNDQQDRLNVMWTAVSSLDDSDAVLSFIKGGFVGPWRMYWNIKSEDEKAFETQKAGGEATIQAKIRQGNYTACSLGSRTMLVEALSGIHPDVPLSASKEDIYNILLMKINPFIEKMKAEGKNASQFWELFKQENLVPPRKNLDEAKHIFDKAKCFFDEINQDFDNASKNRDKAEQDLNEETEQDHRLKKKQIFYKAIEIVAEKERSLGEAKQALDEIQNEIKNFERAKQALDKLKADITDELLEGYFEE
ncbi:MAG: hypothetical protein ACRCUQ_04785 [Alphaproteobacteria bacterium]